MLCVAHDRLSRVGPWPSLPPADAKRKRTRSCQEFTGTYYLMALMADQEKRDFRRLPVSSGGWMSGDVSTIFATVLRVAPRSRACRPPCELSGRRVSSVDAPCRIGSSRLVGSSSCRGVGRELACTGTSQRNFVPRIDFQVQMTGRMCAGSRHALGRCLLPRSWPVVPVRGCTGHGASDDLLRVNRLLVISRYAAARLLGTGNLK